MYTKISLYIREPQLEDRDAFLAMTNASQKFHHPWVKAPLTQDEFKAFIERYRQPNQKSFLVFSSEGSLVGVFNLNEIVYGFFQSAYLGFYVSIDFAGKGLMSQGLQLILKEAFANMNLHRLEANIQPENVQSICLIQNNGFRKEGYSARYLKINDEWRDHERWAITIEDWRNENE